jgi:hypothetical protein
VRSIRAVSIEDTTKEVVDLPRHQRLARVRLLLDLDQPGTSDEIEQAWAEEIRARVKAVDEGRRPAFRTNRLRRKWRDASPRDERPVPARSAR